MKDININAKLLHDNLSCEYVSKIHMKYIPFPVIKNVPKNYLYNFHLINILRINYLDDGGPSGRCMEQMCSCNTSAQKGCADEAM